MAPPLWSARQCVESAMRALAGGDGKSAMGLMDQAVGFFEAALLSAPTPETPVNALEAARLLAVQWHYTDMTAEQRGWIEGRVPWFLNDDTPRLAAHIAQALTAADRVREEERARIVAGLDTWWLIVCEQATGKPCGVRGLSAQLRVTSKHLAPDPTPRGTDQPGDGT